MIPDQVAHAISKSRLPCFIYDAAAVRHRTGLALSLVDRYFFPIKACPEPPVLRAALSTGCGLDLCSDGDVTIALETGCPGNQCKFTAACADDSVLRRLSEAGVRLEADSLEQALRWRACGGMTCGLRVRGARPNAFYGPKFGLQLHEVAWTARRLADAGLQLEGLHLHDQHSNLTPCEFAVRLAETFGQAGSEILRRCHYVNIGGGWPMRHGKPATVQDLRAALDGLRGQLAGLGFRGVLHAEPGRWVVGNCGYWAARVAAIKDHSLGGEHRVVVLDTAAPLPCRPSLSPFFVLRGGALLRVPRAVTCDIFGSANTALDIIGSEVRLPPLCAGDVIVSLGHGAYTRSLIPPFNERDRPTAVVIEN